MHQNTYFCVTKTKMTTDLHNAEEVPSLKLSSDELLHIASFLMSMSDNADDNRDRNRNQNNRNRQMNIRTKILILMRKKKNSQIRAQCVKRLKIWQSCVKKEACDILSMVGVCSVWRNAHKNKNNNNNMFWW